jgi:hypothetical protein
MVTVGSMPPHRDRQFVGFGLSFVEIASVCGV